ncbi:rhomboid family intramembrane serine protease [Streptomyces sp. NPDC029721]|uniref:rhomboid family intramembrane serine protease n=1 Tax=Streptomyces sp. NPDC029721 TaxID=3157090 RepID=UPI0033C5ADFE
MGTNTTDAAVPEWSRRERAAAAAKLMLGWVALLWALEAVDYATGHALDRYGIVSRDVGTLWHIVPAAFLHFGFGHVASNSVPLLVLGFITALSGIRRFVAVCGLVLLGDGIGTWLISPSNTLTLGASGVVFGLFGYLLIRGFVERKPLGVAVSLGVAAVWGTTILVGILPTNTAVSWQGHLCGLATGIATALHHRRPEPRLS